MKNDSQNTIFHILLTAGKNRCNYGFFSKKKKKKVKITSMVAWWGNPCLLIFGFFSDAKLWKTIPRIQFSIFFWPSEKIVLTTRKCWWNYGRFSKKKKKKKSENRNNGGTARESPPRDFRIILNAKYFFWWSKVNGKSYSVDRFS